MRVECVSRLGSALPKTCRDPIGGFDEDTRFDLTVGKQYVVYAMTIHLGHAWYFLCDDVYNGWHPNWNPSPLFEIVDGRLSKRWRSAYYGYGGEGQRRLIIAFREWAEEPEYWDRLVDRDEQYRLTWIRNKEFMDLEFPDMAVSKSAVKLDDPWVMCPDCNEGWEGTPETALVKCPKCGALLVNPLWTDR